MTLTSSSPHSCKTILKHQGNWHLVYSSQKVKPTYLITVIPVISYLFPKQYSFDGQWNHPKAGKILGALDLGGASTQISFTPKDPVKDPAFSADLQLYGYRYQLYTYSYLCYGKDQALKKLQAYLQKVSAQIPEVTMKARGRCKQARVKKIDTHGLQLVVIYINDVYLCKLCPIQCTTYYHPTIKACS